MGRQTRFHMLPDDCRLFVQALQERNPVLVADWQSPSSSELLQVPEPWTREGSYCLWNQAVLPVLCREITGDYFNVSFSAPVIQFSFSPSTEQWDGQPALVQGRIWASFEASNEAFSTWYNATVRWIRKNSLRDHALGLERDSISPRAYEWFKTGGLLLPSFRPPLTAEWLGWAKAQNEHRGKLIADASSL